MRKPLFPGVALFAALLLSACASDSEIVVPDSLPNVIPATTESIISGINTAAATDAQITAVTSVSGTTATAASSVTGTTGSTPVTQNAAATTFTAQNTTITSISTITTTVLTTTTIAPQQIFTPIAGEWYIDGDPAKGRLTINAQGVFTAYDGKNKVTAVGQAKHEIVTNASGTSEIRYNLYNKFNGKVAVSILDTGAASYSELTTGTDTKVYYTQKGKTVQIPDEAARKQIVQDAVNVVQALEKLAAGNVVLDEASLLPANELYTKVKIAPDNSEITFKTAAEIRKVMEEKLTGVAKAKYVGLVSGDMPQYLDANGAFYALPVVRTADYAWGNAVITLGAAANRSFAATVQYMEKNGAVKIATLTFQLENGNWKLASIEEKA